MVSVEILLGGWKNTKSSVNNRIQNTWVDQDEEMVEIAHQSGNHLDENKFITFTIDWSGPNLIVRRYDEVILRVINWRNTIWTPPVSSPEISGESYREWWRRIPAPFEKVFFGSGYKNDDAGKKTYWKINVPYGSNWLPSEFLYSPL